MNEQESPADLLSQAALPSGGSPLPRPIVAGPPAEPPIGPSVEYSPPSCASWTPTNEDELAVNGNLRSAPTQIGKARTIVAKRAALLRWRIRFTSIQRLLSSGVSAAARTIRDRLTHDVAKVAFVRPGSCVYRVDSRRRAPLWNRQECEARFLLIGCGLARATFWRGLLWPGRLLLCCRGLRRTFRAALS